MKRVSDVDDDVYNDDKVTDLHKYTYVDGKQDKMKGRRKLRERLTEQNIRFILDLYIVHRYANK
jgi:hypothetical protein